MMSVNSVGIEQMTKDYLDKGGVIQYELTKLQKEERANPVPSNIVIGFKDEDVILVKQEDMEATDMDGYELIHGALDFFGSGDRRRLRVRYGKTADEHDMPVDVVQNMSDRGVNIERLSSLLHNYEG